MLSKTTQKYFLWNFQYTRFGGKVLKGSNAETDTNGIRLNLNIKTPLAEKFWHTRQGGNV